MKSEESLFTDIKLHKCLFLTAFVIVLCSCGSHRTVQTPYSVPIHITENARVEFDTPIVTTQEVAQPATWKDTIEARLDSLCQQPLFETTQLGL